MPRNMNKQLMGGVKASDPKVKGQGKGMSTNHGIYLAEQNKQACRLNKNIEAIITSLANSNGTVCDEMVTCIGNEVDVQNAITGLMQNYWDMATGDLGQTRLCESVQDCVGNIFEDYAYDDANNTINIVNAANFDEANSNIEITGSGTTADPFTLNYDEESCDGVITIDASMTPYSVPVDIRTILVDTSIGDVTIDVGLLPMCNRITAKKITADANEVIINPINPGSTVDLQTTYSFGSNGILTAIEVQSDNNQDLWII